MTGSELKSKEHDDVFSYEEHELITYVKITTTCKRCFFSSPGNCVNGGCSAPRINASILPCIRGDGHWARFIPIAKYAELRIKGEL